MVIILGRLLVGGSNPTEPIPKILVISINEPKFCWKTIHNIWKPPARLRSPFQGFNHVQSIVLKECIFQPLDSPGWWVPTLENKSRRSSLEFCRTFNLHTLLRHASAGSWSTNQPVAVPLPPTNLNPQPIIHELYSHLFPRYSQYPFYCGLVESPWYCDWL